ncbi:MAG: flippase-like domain-containing protein [Acidobacteriia bacterium]|nr:flippase-like domain-containing protein [Terriglobia bacterium]
MARSRKTRALVLGLIVSALFLWLALRNADLRQTWFRLRDLDGRYLLLPVGMTLLNYPLRAWRWQRIFPPHARPGFWVCFQTLAVGNALNNFVPGRGGDLARCVLVSRKTSLAGGTLALATLGVEKILDGLALLAVVLLSFRFLTPPQWMARLEIAAAIIFGGALAVVIVLRYRSPWLLGWVERRFRAAGFAALGERIAHLGSSFAEGLHAVASMRDMTVLLAITAAIWTTEAGLVCGLAWAMHVPMSLAAGLMVCAVLGLALMIPAAPGALGTYEFFSSAAIALTGVGAAIALALTLVLHAWVLLSTSITGLCCAGSTVTLRALASQAEPVEGAEEASAACAAEHK